MTKLKNIFSSLDLEEQLAAKLEHFLVAKRTRNNFIYPQDISNSLGISPRKVSLIIYHLVVSELLDTYTIPYSSRINKFFEDKALDKAVVSFKDLQVFDPDSYEELDVEEDLIPVAAFKLSNENA